MITKPFFTLFRLLIIVLIIFSCAPNPYKGTNKIYRQQARQFAKVMKQYPLRDSVNNAPYFAGTTNFSMRRPNFVVIHHTAQNSCAQTLQTFVNTASAVSAHYVICRDGTVFHMLNDMLRAHHAGVSKWGNATDLNSNSIGI
jgi:N-acetylmuramoyl-L-alanine amidase